MQLGPNTSEAQPSLETARLRLRPYTLADALIVAQLAGRKEIADTTAAIPHPYSEQHARDFFKRSGEEWKEGKGVVFALVTKHGEQMIGAVGLHQIDREHRQAEMGFWIAVDRWGQGYATEAAQALVRFAFEKLELNRVYAHHMLRNPASGRVMEKVGMKREGILRQRIRKWGVFEDVAIFAVLREDWA